MAQTVGSDGSQGGRVMRSKLTGGTFPGMKPTVQPRALTQSGPAKKPKAVSEPNLRKLQRQWDRA